MSFLNGTSKLFTKVAYLASARKRFEVELDIKSIAFEGAQTLGDDGQVRLEVLKTTGQVLCTTLKLVT
jgi:hypothetical protein